MFYVVCYLALPFQDRLRSPTEAPMAQDGPTTTSRKPQDGPKTAPTGTPDCSQSHLQRIFRQLIFSLLGRILGEAPRCFQEAPKRSPRSSKKPQKASKKLPRGSQEPHKRPPGGSKEPSSGHLGAILEPSWAILDDLPRSHTKERYVQTLM